MITSDFNSLADVGWYGAAYLVTSATFQPLNGKLYVNFDTKWTYMTFLAIFELGSLICGVAISSNMLIVGRAIAGVGFSGIQVGTFTIIAACAPMEKRPALMGVAMGIAQTGLAIGPLIGGALTEYATWRWCFYLNLPLGCLVALLLFFIKIPANMVKPKAVAIVRDLPKKLDLVGFALFAPAAIQLLLALQYGGNQYAWNSSVVIGLFCGASATFFIFCVWDVRKGDAAMIPISMIQQQIVWSSCLAFCFLMSHLFITQYYLPIYFQGVKEVSPTLSGVYLLPTIITQLIFAVGIGKAVQRVGYYLPFILFSAILLAISGGLLSTFTPDESTAKWIGYQIILGVGRGCGIQMPIVAIQNNLAPPRIPIAMALVMFSQTLGGAMFLSFSDTIFTNSLRTLIPQYAPDVDAQAVVMAGATEFHNILSPHDLSNVLVAYALSIDRVFYLSAATGIACFAFAWGMGWKDIRRKAMPMSNA